MLQEGCLSGLERGFSSTVLASRQHYFTRCQESACQHNVGFVTDADMSASSRLARYWRLRSGAQTGARVTPTRLTLKQRQKLHQYAVSCCFFVLGRREREHFYGPDPQWFLRHSIPAGRHWHQYCPPHVPANEAPSTAQPLQTAAAIKVWHLF
jgi:hypothetical protein